jgi:hypothetical protein
MEALPCRDMCCLNGALNLASHLPKYAPMPDLGM